jgi:predicted DNA-binding transcriptional regulator YafY
MASEIVQHLTEQGYPVEKHNVLRDLKALQGTFGQLECNDNSHDGHAKRGEAYGWLWRGTDPPPDGGLTIPEALSVVLVERYLSQTLPASLTRAFEALFRQAESTLALQGKSPESHWLQKVCVVEPAQPLAAPVIDDKVLQVVHEGLLKIEQIVVRHWAPHRGEKELTLHPQGLLLRGQTTYLVAMAGDSDQQRFYALHRIREAKRSFLPARQSPVSIDEYAAEHGHFGTGQQIRLRLRMIAYLAVVLRETPLDPGQMIGEPDADGRCVIEADVRDTWQLRWWILGQGKSVEVLAPKELRDAIGQELQDAIGQYPEQAHREWKKISMT